MKSFDASLVRRILEKLASVHMHELSQVKKVAWLPMGDSHGLQLPMAVQGLSEVRIVCS